MGSSRMRRKFPQTHTQKPPFSYISVHFAALIGRQISETSICLELRPHPAEIVRSIHASRQRIDSEGNRNKLILGGRLSGTISSMLSPSERSDGTHRRAVDPIGGYRVSRRATREIEKRPNGLPYVPGDKDDDLNASRREISKLEGDGAIAFYCGLAAKKTEMIFKSLLRSTHVR